MSTSRCESLLIHRQQDLATFDEAFRVFWRPPPGEWSTADLRALGEQRRFGTPHVDTSAGGSAAAGDGRSRARRSSASRP